MFVTVREIYIQVYYPLLISNRDIQEFVIIHNLKTEPMTTVAVS